jgi:3-oxoacyl-[acyl-carrier protein] reductase
VVEGCRLVLVSRRAADLDVARTEIEERYNVSVRTDAADPGDSANVARLARLFPDVDILVNNAGACG